jgi:photosystem II stability/assembly factor-like uncharacterized protein
MIYIGTDSGLYRWFGEMPWPVFHALQDRAIVDLATGPDGLMAARDGTGRLVVSRDSGMTWLDVPAPAGVGRPTQLRIEPGSSDLVLATAGPLRLYRRSLRPAPPPRRRSDAAARARDWITGLRRGGGPDPATAVVDPEAETTRRGWSRMGAPQVDRAADLAGLTLLEPGHEPGSWYAGVPGAGLLRGTQGGARWEAVEGLGGEALCLESAGDALLAGTDDGVRTSRDGRVWTPLGDLGGRNVTALAARPGDAKHLWAGVGPGSDGPGLFESKDAGQTWKRVARGFPEHLGEARIVAIRYDRDDAETALVALSTGELYRTRTDGLWWEPIARQIHGARALA